MTTSTQPSSADQHQTRNAHLATLLASCDQGDESAFEELYRLCSGQLYGLLIRIIRIESVAEEALQDSFVKIWQKAGMYAPENGTPMAWMCSIARNQGLDLLRRRSVREGREQADLHGVIEATPDTTKPLHEMSDDASLLMQCLDKLPKDVRNCIVSAYCEGYSHEELSQRSGSPVGTVKSWIRRGLISLRECVDELA